MIKSIKKIYYYGFLLCIIFQFCYVLFWYACNQNGYIFIVSLKKDIEKENFAIKSLKKIFFLEKKKQFLWENTNLIHEHDARVILQTVPPEEKVIFFEKGKN